MSALCNCIRCETAGTFLELPRRVPMVVEASGAGAPARTATLSPASKAGRAGGDASSSLLGPSGAFNLNSHGTLIS